MRPTDESSISMGLQLYTIAVDSILHILVFTFNFILDIIPFFLAIAVITLIERRLMGSIQRRRGPNMNGDLGLFQPIADGLKLIIKEIFHTTEANAGLFISAPLFTLFFTIVCWCMIPGAQHFALVELEYFVFFFIIIGTFNVQAIILSGWSGNSKYAFLGGVRAASQMISYEICMGTVIASVMLQAGSASITEIVYCQYDIWFVVPLFPTWILFVIVSLAETNRTPFDLVEAEAELVAGYNVEYSGIFFVLFFISEYGNILIMSTISTLFFFGGWLVPFTSSIEDSVEFAIQNWTICGIWFSLKTTFNVLIFIVIRATIPRYRYDQLMSIGWKALMPFCISLVLLQSSIIILFDHII